MSLTTLNEDLDTSETGVDITPSVTAGTRPALILVENELMDVSAGTSSLTVVRGSNGTAAATHANTTPVYQVLRVSPRADSLLVYYIGDDGATAAKKIVIVGDSTSVLPSVVGHSLGDMLRVSNAGDYEIITPAFDITATPSKGLYTVEGHITEAGAGTYTISTPVVATQRLLEIYWYTDTAFGAATSATLEMGVTGTLNGFGTAINCKAQGAGSTHSGTGTLWGTSNEGAGPAGKAGYYFAAGTNVIVTVITVGAGTTGRFRCAVVLSQPQTVIEATKT